MPPVKQCDECEILYCGDKDRCLRGLKECQNKKCTKAKPFSTMKISKIAEKVFDALEFKDGNDPEKSITYVDKCKQLIEAFKAK